MEERPSMASLPGAKGLYLNEKVKIAQPRAMVAYGEFGHIHPDGSLHAALSYERAMEAVDKGWAESHPWSDRDGLEGFVMLFTPKTMDEVDVTFQLIVDSYNFVAGRSVNASDFGKAETSDEEVEPDEDVNTTVEDGDDATIEDKGDAPVEESNDE